MSLLNLKRKIDYKHASLSIKEWKLVKRDEEYLYFLPEDNLNNSLLRVPISESEKVLTYRIINPVGNSIRKSREEKSMSQRQLSAKSGVSQMTISNVENGTCERINSDILDAVLKALDIPLTEIYQTS